MLLDFRKPNCYILEKIVSWSGQYLCFYGNHYEAGVICYVVGTSNKSNGEVIMRHYNEKIKDCLAPKAQAETYWEEFKSKMLKTPESEEQDDHGFPFERRNAPFNPTKIIQ